MTDTKENIMGTLPIGKLLMKMSVPVILSMLVSTLYGVIDSIFVSRLGDNALTAMSLATPISSPIACITVGFSVGMNAELSKKLGEGDIDGANKAAGNGILVNWSVAGIFLIFGLFFVPMFYRLQTDNATIQRIGTDYTSIRIIVKILVQCAAISQKSSVHCAVSFKVIPLLSFLLICDYARSGHFSF